MFSTIHSQDRVRRTKTNIVRTRTGCQNCRKRRRKCDEGRPECQGCVKRGIKCSGYERTIAFKDVSSLAAESSRKFEAARWAALRAEDERLGRKRSRVGASSTESGDRVVETLSSDAGSDHDGDRSSSSSTDPPSFRMSSSPRHSRRAPSSFARQASFFQQSNDQLPQIDPALYQSPPQFYQPPDNCDHSTSFDLGDTPESPEATHSSSLTTTTTLEPPLPPLILHMSPAKESALIAHFESHVLSNLPVPMTFDASYMVNSCFRHAILALSSVNQAYLQTVTPTGPDFLLPTARRSRSPIGREHYLCAVSELYRRLDLSDPVAREQHAAAALMLAYYEIETGSPFASVRHAQGLEALLSKIDLLSPQGCSSSSTTTTTTPASIPSAMPNIFKAWRMLRYDVRYMAAPYRLSSVHTDAHDAYAFLDPQLAIRDVYTHAWNLMGRLELEASFTPSPAKGSRSRQAAVWIRDVAGRVCDTRNVERADYHLDEVSDDEVLARCERFGRALDSWHDKLGVEDRPVLKVGSGKPFVTGESGSSFEPIPVFGFGGGDRSAFEYIMYVTARLIVSYLLSVYGPRGRARPDETAAWANLLFGVVCGMRHRSMKFSYITPVENIAQAAMLCEGVAPVNALLEGVIPYVLDRGIPVAELAEWLYLKKALEIVRRERTKGKTIRGMLLSLDEDYEKGQFDTRFSFLAFGDYNGRGHFRDIYAMDGGDVMGSSCI
ncbi:C6 zinc finger domain protein [Coniochaeta hoffmannii]|uniref:C6 zinc finger domain protein n=1 Tax=Coniochaeta hoffmannii TaxID=91930 RepID=A0AA38RS47_9PEZI|nr:C6 zinc finger domain protein [Coniochaeta hoffmannii]